MFIKNPVYGIWNNCYGKLCKIHWIKQVILFILVNVAEYEARNQTPPPPPPPPPLLPDTHTHTHTHTQWSPPFCNFSQILEKLSLAILFYIFRVNINMIRAHISNAFITTVYY